MPVRYSGFGSPVIGPDGTIYVGSMGGKLYAVRPDSSEKWVWDGFVEDQIQAISRSPAVDEDGDVFVVGQRFVKVVAGYQVESRVSKIDKDTGQAIWTTPLKGLGFCNASPKVWNTGDQQNIFLQFHSLDGEHLLLVLNSKGRLIHSQPLGCAPQNDSWRSDTLDPTTTPETSTKRGPYGLEEEFYPYRFEKIMTSVPDPTPAILDSEDLQAKDSPILVVATQCSVQALRWDPQNLDPALRMQQLWIDTQPQHNYTSPACAEDGTVFVGRDDDHLVAYDMTGNRVWSQDFVGNNDFVGSPALFPLGDAAFFVYCPTVARLYKINAGNGAPFQDFGVLYPNLESPAVTLDRVYLGTRDGMYSMDLSLGDIQKDPDPTTKVYLTSPAIGPDGSVYIVTKAGDLIAYMNQEELSRSQQ